MQLLFTGLLVLLFAPGTAADPFVDFKQLIPDTDQAIEMVALSGGEFAMGSPAEEVGRGPDEGPVHAVKVGDFWIGKFEINWQQYEVFVHRDEAAFQRLATAQLAQLGIDGVTGATTPYVEMSFGMGKDGYPAINVTQYAALRYARWLSAKTGLFYRLPTEAEWEYACRAGTTSPWSFGDDAQQAEDYAVYSANSDGQYQRPGSKLANPYGLFDMHGNVAEWTMDQYDSTWYQRSGADNPWLRPQQLYPRVARGGSWLDEADQLRCAARQASRPEWKERDPQIPKSLWWHTNAPFVGFRLVRPRIQPDPEDISRYWLEALEDLGI